MSMSPAVRGANRQHAANPHASVDIKDLKNRESRYWYLLGAICILTTGGLALAISPLLLESMTDLWPWSNSHIVFLAGLFLSVVMLVVYMTIQKQQTGAIRRQVETVAEDSAVRERQNSARLRALLNVSRMMGAVTDIENVFQTITETCLEVFNCQQASLMLVNEQTRDLEIRAATGHANLEAVKRATLKIGEGVSGWVAERRQPLVLNRDTDVSQYPGLQLKDDSISAAMLVPIVLRDELVGVLAVSSRSAKARYSEEDLQALQVFAENAGTCIRHTEHVEWMRKTIQGTLEHSRHNPTHTKNTEALTRE